MAQRVLGGQGAALPAANAGSRAPRSALWHFVNSTASAAAPLPAPPGTRWHWLPRLGGNRPRSGRLGGAGAKEGVGASALRGPASIFSRCSVPHGQRKRLILTLGRRGLGWCQRCPAPGAVRTQSLARCHPKVPSPRFGEPFFFVCPPSCTWPRPCETLTRAPACGTGGEGRAVPAPGQPCRRSFQYFWLCCSCHPAPRPCPATLRRAGEQQEPLGCRGRPVR